jgi:simple sugar transport system ATP-binding protein
MTGGDLPGVTVTALHTASGNTYVGVTDERGVRALADVSLIVRRGEIFGIAGVDGNGQSELFEVFAGLRAPRSGSIAVDGTELASHTPQARIEAGVVSIPPDRRRQGSIAELSVQDNAILNRVLLKRLAHGPFLDPVRRREIAGRLVEEHRVRVPGLDAPVSSLSGGNLQRLIVARALAIAPRVLVAFNPTRGLDIAAARAVHGELIDACAGGAAILLISTELDEVLEISNRIAVLHRGRLSEPLEPPVSSEQLGMLMGGEAVRSASPG